MRAILIPTERSRRRGSAGASWSPRSGPSCSSCSRPHARRPTRRTTGRRGRSPSSRPSIPCSRPRERVGGDLVDVTNLTAPGVEPHDLELAPDQAEAIATRRRGPVPGRGVPARGAGRDRRRGRPSPSTCWPGCRRSSRRAGARRASRSTRTCGSTRRCTRGWSTRCAPRSPRPRPSTRRRSDRTPTRSRRRSTRWPTTTPPAWRTAIGRCSSRTTPRSATWPRRTA